MQSEQLNVTGMTCGGCTAKVTKALKAIRGVKDVQVSLAKAAATVQFDEQLTSTAQMKSAIQQAGYGTAGDDAAHSTPTQGGCCA
ncbi:MAG: heavy-metal-associated domain-containing protein [Steroidobacteraceae bacterium]